MQTEQRNPRSMRLHQMNTIEIVTLINEEDQTVAGVIRHALPQIAAAVDVITDRLKEGGRLFYVGAGTSGRLGVLDAAECIPTFNTPPEQVQALIAGGAPAMTQAVEGAEDDRQAAIQDLKLRGVSHADVVVGIAASGRTPYVLAAVRYAADNGAKTIGVACNDDSPLLQGVEYPIALPVGPEVITGSTRMKAGTAQKMVLNMISSTVMIHLGKVYENLMVDVQPTNEKLNLRARRIVSEIAGCSEDDAQSLLQAADNHVKTAVVMALLNVDRATAEQHLKAANDNLGAVLS